jgi:hypothetical protein
VKRLLGNQPGSGAAAVILPGDIGSGGRSLREVRDDIAISRRKEGDMPEKMCQYKHITTQGVEEWN